MSALELDDATRARLRWEAERLAAEQDMDLKVARQIVWADYLDEQMAPAPAPPPPEPEVPLPEPPAPAPPATVVTMPTHPVRGFWQASNTCFFTPERLQRNRDEIANVKRLIGLRT